MPSPRSPLKTISLPRSWHARDASPGMSILSFDLADALRRTRPQRVSSPITRRRDNDLPFVPDQIEAGRELMLDTCVYIDIVQGRVPQIVDNLLVARISNHS